MPMRAKNGHKRTNVVLKKSLKPVALNFIKVTEKSNPTINS